MGRMTTPTDEQHLLARVFAPSDRADPYPHFRSLRESGPWQSSALHLAVFSSFADCDEALRHPMSASDRLKSTLAQRQIEAGEAPRPFGLAGIVDRRRTPAFLFLDPPDHTRLRKLVSNAYIPRVINELRPVMVEMVDQMMDAIEERGSFDAVADLAYPLAVAVICRLLGVPLEDEAQFGRASALVGQAVDPFLTLAGEEREAFEERMRAGKWLRDYHRQLIESRRSRPTDDLLSALIAAEESGDQLTEDEIISTCNLLLIAGHESTVSLIAHAVLAMLRDRSQWSALGVDPRRAPRVVEETLRYDAPAQMLARIAAEDMTIGDTAVAQGDTMVLVLAAAHRDPAANDRPDVFDPDRKVFRHLAFGHGTHFCIGASLVRLEASIALSAVTARFPNARLADEPIYQPNVTLRGMSSLPVSL
jgi:cytochrome P450